MAQSWEGSEFPLNAHSATPVVPLAQCGGQEKGKGHGSESKTGDPGGGEGAPECQVPSGAAWPPPAMSWGLAGSVGLAWGPGQEVR